MPRTLAVLLVFLVVCATGCQSHPVVTAPTASGPTTDVYLAHYDFYHTSLVVPHDDGHLTEYTYADWDVLAIDDRSTWTKFKAILLPSRGTLGRASIAWDRTSDDTLCAALAGCWKLSRYQVETRRLERLVATLDAGFETSLERTGSTQREGMDFVKAQRPYSLAHNCNHALREWLLALGFRVDRGVALADFQTPDAVHTFAPGRETRGMRTDFNELVGERPDVQPPN